MTAHDGLLHHSDAALNAKDVVGNPHHIDESKPTTFFDVIAYSPLKPPFFEARRRMTFLGGCQQRRKIPAKSTSNRKETNYN